SNSQTILKLGQWPQLRSRYSRSKRIWTTAVDTGCHLHMEVLELDNVNLDIHGNTMHPMAIPTHHYQHVNMSKTTFTICTFNLSGCTDHPSFSHSPS
uniref:Uncharacterized protein n=1 Tax=Varanus komodoensis TaxID=61221 RepID=A0A8D2IPV2_VARKO